MTGLEIPVGATIAKFAGAAASPLIRTALESGKRRLENIKEATAAEVAATRAYVETANDLMMALEGSSDILMISAMRLPQAQEPTIARNELAGGIDLLMWSEAARPVLIGLRTQLEVCQKQLMANALTFFGIFEPMADQQKAIGKLREFLKYMDRYLGGLPEEPEANSQQPLQLPDELPDEVPEDLQRAATAPFIETLKELKALLAGKSANTEIADWAVGRIREMPPPSVPRNRFVGTLLETLRVKLK